ncbi:bacterioferritin [Enhygromyxa salina]|uniref:Bacterioferritin n=1 Tax=Enhygromyxa salina TaxID=215803 RepID=A0A0C2A595_9BACT|nr:ferritin-like domain-containing protein [Enhygromyxa salina]KIG18608.1 bacterioferritin [Enhygromyxa salina]
MTADMEEFLDRLDNAMAWELAGALQYMQHAVLVTGIHRDYLRHFFHESSELARDHAEHTGDKIAAFGRVPGMTPQKIRQETEPAAMLTAALALEMDMLAAWERVHEVAGVSNKGTLFWVEQQIAEEQAHVDELRKMTQQVKFARP